VHTGLGHPGAHFFLGAGGIEGRGFSILGVRKEPIKIRIKGKITKVHAINVYPFLHKYVIRRIQMIL
jgi:hypothetical protein